MSRGMYTNRYANMHRVCDAIGDAEFMTCTDISKVTNLSRQAINSILKDCALYGYVRYTEEPYRQHIRRLWTVTDFWKMNRNVYRNIYLTNDEVKQGILL